MSEQQTSPVRQNDNGPRRVRVGTVVWGFILIAFAALYFSGAQLDLSNVRPGVILAWAVIVIGAIALTGAVVAATTRRR